MKHKKIVIMQIVFLVVIGIVIYIIYPRVSLEINGNLVRFKSVNANVIILSENPDFSNPRYLDINNNVSIRLKPGKYYWKSSNSLINGFRKEIFLDSEVGLSVENDSLVNIGNVKVNVTKNKEGVMVGHIILEPEEAEEIEDSGEYVGRQEK